MYKHLIGIAALLSVSALSIAAPLPPLGYNADVGASLFAHTDTAVAIELVDDGQTSPPPGGWTFGFYFASDPGTLITIFDADDDSQAYALIDFANGLVIDVEDNAPQTGFTTSANPIGFFVTLEIGTIYSQSYLNPGLVDLGFAFQSINDPSLYLIGFDFGNYGISLELINGIHAIPEPGVVALFGGGLLAIGFGRRRSRRQRQGFTDLT